MKKGPGLDIGPPAIRVREAGRVNPSRWLTPVLCDGRSQPRARGRAAVCLPADQQITAENAAGKVVIRGFRIGSIPFGVVGSLLGLYQTPDLGGRRLCATVPEPEHPPISWMRARPAQTG